MSIQNAFYVPNFTLTGGGRRGGELYMAYFERKFYVVENIVCDRERQQWEGFSSSHR